jgi:hypothetical protein
MNCVLTIVDIEVFCGAVDLFVESKLLRPNMQIVGTAFSGTNGGAHFRKPSHVLQPVASQ